MTTRRALASALVLMALTAGCAAGDQEEAPAPVTGETAPPAAEEPEPSTDADTGADTETEPSSEPEPDDAASALITISDFTFTVPETVAPGTKITVTNEDSSFHTVTADDGAFDVGAPQGESVTFTAPDEPGEYSFHCGPHPEMVATLVVG